MVSFKDRMKQLRLDINLTLKELGEKLGYSESTMSMYESGKREPKKAEDYIRIAEFFDVSLDYLLGQTDNKHNRVYETEIDGNKYHMELDNTMPYNLTPEEVKELIKRFETMGFDINKFRESLEKENK